MVSRGTGRFSFNRYRPTGMDRSGSDPGSGFDNDFDPYQQAVDQPSPVTMTRDDAVIEGDLKKSLWTRPIQA